MRKLACVIQFAILAGTLVMSVTSRAGCTVKNPVTNIAGGIPGSFSVSSSLPVGSTIGGLISVPRSTPNSTGIVCTGFSTYDVLLNLNTTWALSTTPGVYQTSIPGIGVKVSLVQSRKNIAVLTPEPQVWYWETAQNVPSPGGGASFTEGIKVQFYVTGPLTPGIYPSEPLVETWFSDRYTPPSSAGGANIVTYLLPEITIKSPGCTTPDITVNLGKHQTGEFSGIYSTSAAKSFNFEVKNCSSDTTTVSYTFKPATSAGVSLAQANTSSQHLTLNSTSSATGVGVQVLDQHDALIPFNSKITSGYTAGANGYVIPMKARYIKTASTVTAGQADSALEFTMTYE